MKNVFEKLGESARKVVGNVKDAVGAKCEEVQLSVDIAAHQDELHNLFAELGRLTYHGNADLAGVRPKDMIMDDIANVSSNIESLQEELAALTAPKEAPEPEVASCFCHKCGKPQSEDSCFCNKCGAKLNR